MSATLPSSIIFVCQFCAAATTTSLCDALVRALQAQVEDVVWEHTSPTIQPAASWIPDSTKNLRHSKADACGSGGENRQTACTGAPSTNTSKFKVKHRIQTTNLFPNSSAKQLWFSELLGTRWSLGLGHPLETYPGKFTWSPTLKGLVIINELLQEIQIEAQSQFDMFSFRSDCWQHFQADCCAYMRVLYVYHKVINICTQKNNY